MPIDVNADPGSVESMGIPSGYDVCVCCGQIMPAISVEYVQQGDVQNRFEGLTCYPCRETFIWHSSSRRFIPRHDALFVSDLNLWLSHGECDAYYGGIYRCRNCGSRNTDESTTYDEMRAYCNDCHADLFTECAACGDMHNRDGCYTFGGSYYCTECWGERYATCAQCSRAVERDNVNEDNLCAACVEHSYIRNYGHKPQPRFLDDKQGRAWYAFQNELQVPVYRNGILHDYVLDGIARCGIELEVECHSQERMTLLCKRLNEYTIKRSGFSPLKAIYCKEDGSLGDYGVEIVTHPMTERFFMAHWLPYWTKELSRMRSAGIRSRDTSTCGMHVHISRTAFSKLGIYKAQKLIYQNAHWILKLSGRRDANDINHYSAVENPGAINNLYARKAKDMDQDYSRYVAFNLRNAATVELRFFKGTLHENSYIRNMQFAYALPYYCKWVSARNCTSESFRQFVIERLPHFRQLAVFCGKKIAKPKVKCELPLINAVDYVSPPEIELVPLPCESENPF